MENRCPQCNHTLPVHTEYVKWCDLCNWNLNPLQPDKPKNLWETFYETLGQSQSRRLFEKFKQAPSLEPRMSLPRLLAILFSLFIHIVTISFVVVGMTLLIRGWPNIFALFGAIVCLLIGWQLRPRFAKMPAILPRGEYPALYRFVDDIAHTLGAKPITGIIVDDQFNASIGTVTRHRKQILTLGLPLWSILTIEERAALIGHELGHSVNGDPARTFLVGTALDSLLRWYEFLHPALLWEPQRGLFALVELPINLLFLIMAQLPKLSLYMLAYLLYRDTQRAEYLADHKAAVVAGTRAALASLEKMYFEGTYQIVRNRVTAVRNTNRDFFQELAERMRQVPPHEVERIRRIQQLEGSRLYITHPPTPYRIDMLLHHPVDEARLVAAHYDAHQMDAELAAIRDDINQRFNSLSDYYLQKLKRRG